MRLCVRLSDATVPRFNSPAEPARTVSCPRFNSPAEPAAPGLHAPGAAAAAFFSAVPVGEQTRERREQKGK